jgi:hypothetical protein
MCRWIDSAIAHNRRGVLARARFPAAAPQERLANQIVVPVVNQGRYAVKKSNVVSSVKYLWSHRIKIFLSLKFRCMTIFFQTPL